MSPEDLNARLSRLSTAWTDLVHAHGGPADVDQLAAQRAVLERYQRPVYRYLLGALRDPEAADELFQEFALQFLRGAFRHADPQRGRFRDYLKTTLAHLVTNHRRRQRGRTVSLSPDTVEPAVEPSRDETELEFTRNWREGLLERAWTALGDVQAETGQPYHAVLQWRIRQPELTSAELAERLTADWKPQRPFTDTGIRKTLQRAREWFADLLLDQVAHSLTNPTREQLEAELIDLELLEYCRPALQRRNQ
jgi:RNA polymerase sigma-70 factor (ECF subfamily)